MLRCVPPETPHFTASHSQGRPTAGSMVFPSEAEFGPELREAAGVQPLRVEDWNSLEGGSACLPFSRACALAFKRKLVRTPKCWAQWSIEHLTKRGRVMVIYTDKYDRGLAR